MKRILAVAVLLVLSGALGAQCTPLALTTTFAHNNGQSGNMFDVVAQNDVTICSFDVNLDPGAWDLEIWALPQGLSWAVDPANATGNWSLIASFPGITSNGAGIATPLVATLGLSVPAGATQAFYVTTTATGQMLRYTNGTAIGTVAASDANLQVLEGAGKAYPFGTTFQPRVWNGVVHYCTGLGAPCPVPPPPPFQVNQPDASLGIDAGAGAPQTTGVAPAVTAVCGGSPVTFDAASAGLAGNPFEIIINAAPLIPSHLVTPGGQVLNVDVLGAAWLNGGALPSFVPFVPFSVPVTAPTGLAASVQLAILDATAVDGVVLSQGARLEAGTGATPVAPAPGPVGDDQAIQFNVATAPLCAAGGVSLYGTLYTDVFVSSNGRVNVVAGDPDFNPSLGELVTDDPFVGLWTDLSPNLGGAVSLYMTGTGDLCVAWQAVPYFGEVATTSHVVCFEAGGDITIDVSGSVANPLLGPVFTSGDAQLLGISNGNLGSPVAPAPQDLGLGASAAPGAPLFDFWDGTPATAPGGLGLVQSIQSVQNAGLTGIRLIDTGGGAYLSLPY